MNADFHDIEIYIPRLRRYARALVGDTGKADDLVQDTLERALKKFSLWQHNTDLRAWLFTIMHNIYVNQGRASTRRSHLMHDERDAVEQSVQGAQEASLALRDMCKALYQLSEEFREVVLLVGLEQLSYDEVAQVLDIPKGTVMSRLSRGREKLRLLMSGEYSQAPSSSKSDNESFLRRVK